MNREKNAVLVFANAPAIDCHRRHWPATFRQLFRVNGLEQLRGPDCDVHLFSSRHLESSQASSVVSHTQEGSTFREKLENAIEALAQLGYAKIVVVGSDCPDLSAEDVDRAFRLLDQNRLVLGPDQRGGCYLIGLHAHDREGLKRVRWQQNTDLAELTARFGSSCTALLRVKLDLDTLCDLRALALSSSPLRSRAGRLIASLALINTKPRLCNCAQFQIPRIFWQLPPPPIGLLSTV